MSPPRVLLVHGREAEVQDRLERLVRAGFRPERLAISDAGAVRAARSHPPAAFVIDLTRQPSQGRDIGLYLRQRKATRAVPLVFVAGAPGDVARVKKLLPDAVYTAWRGVGGALKRALARPPERPMSPGVMAGYSGTPLVKKLGIKPAAAVALLGAPAGFEDLLQGLPAGIRLRRAARGRSDVILLFARTRAELVRRFPGATRALVAGGRLWLIWPKRSSGLQTDLGEAAVRAYGMGSGFVDYKIAAIDEQWSGLCFARRR